MKEIEVRCMPSDLVDHFDVNLEMLKEPGDFIRVSDLNLDMKKYDIHGLEDSVIVSAILPRTVVEEETIQENIEEKD
jgi:hypothetical protein